MTKLSSHQLKALIKEEVGSIIKEYFHSTRDNRQLEVQEFLEYKLEREQLQEFINNPKRGRNYLRQQWPDKFYWWANEDIERFFKNWRI